jgi:hypothetical protein
MDGHKYLLKPQSKAEFQKEAIEAISDDIYYIIHQCNNGISFRKTRTNKRRHTRDAIMIMPYYEFCYCIDNRPVRQFYVSVEKKISENNWDIYVHFVKVIFEDEDNIFAFLDESIGQPSWRYFKEEKDWEEFSQKYYCE